MAEQLRSELSVPADVQTAVKMRICNICDILSGKDKRRLLIIGPCSADNPDAVLEYSYRLAELAEKVNDVFFTVMRVYTAKPRTRGDRYMGLVHMPDPESGVTDTASGLYAARKLHLRVAAEAGLPTADEMLYPELTAYTDDIVSYVTVGARTSESPMHRFAASGLDMPVGIKNPINGNASALAGSVHAVSKSNTFVYGGKEVTTCGNKYAHAILRGATDIFGNNIQNYGKAEVTQYVNELAALGSSTGLIVDTGHANSGKVPSRATDVMRAAVRLCAEDAAYAAAVRGFMVESYLVGGNAEIGKQVYGQSVTDPCLGFEDTEKLILGAADALG